MNPYDQIHYNYGEVDIINLSILQDDDILDLKYSQTKF
jgi:hypothetical protein